jgi:hypothetical protein
MCIGIDVRRHAVPALGGYLRVRIVAAAASHVQRLLLQNGVLSHTS